MLITEDKVALKFNINPNGQGFLVKLGIGKESIAQLYAKGWAAKLDPNELTLHKGGHNYAIPLTPTMYAAVNGNAALADKVKLYDLKNAVGSTITHILKSEPELDLTALDLVKADDDPDSLFKPNPVKAASLTFAHTLTGKKPAVKKPAAADVYPTDKMKVGERVQLAKATLLYQPVFGTSGNSRYYVIGVSDSIRVAARYDGHGLHVRVEGPGYAALTKELQEVGFDPHAGKSHASLHLPIGGDHGLAAKSLGAIVFGLGVTLTSPVPDFSIIKAAS